MNTDINEPVPVNVHVDVENKLPEPENPAEEISDEPKSVELAEGSMNSLRELADTIKQNEDDLLEKLGNQAVESNAENARLNKGSITELANDISGASDAMNNQDDTPLKPRADEKAETEDNSRNERPVTEKSLQFDEGDESGDCNGRTCTSPRYQNGYGGKGGKGHYTYIERGANVQQDVIDKGRNSGACIGNRKGCQRKPC